MNDININKTSDDEKNLEILEFLEYFNNKIPNPEMYPKSFEFYVKMFKFAKGYK